MRESIFIDIVINQDDALVGSADYFRSKLISIEHLPIIEYSLSGDKVGVYL